MLCYIMFCHVTLLLIIGKWVHVHICCLSSEHHSTHCGAWWLIGRFVAFRSKGRGFESRCNRHVHVGTRDIGQVLHSQLHVALRRETPTQYSCCVGSTSE